MVPAEGLADEVTADVRLGLLSATCARELGRLPRGNQPKVAQVIARRGLTTRQTTRLIDQLVAAADDRAHAVVLANAERTSPPVVTTARCKYDGQKTVVLRWEGPQPIYNPRFTSRLRRTTCFGR
jgi:hypothetical protein